MTTRKRISGAEFRKALEDHRNPAATRPMIQASVDLRLTTDDLAKLTPEQVQAVFEGVGRLAAQGLTR